MDPGAGVDMPKVTNALSRNGLFRLFHFRFTTFIKIVASPESKATRLESESTIIFYYSQGCFECQLLFNR